MSTVTNATDLNPTAASLLVFPAEIAYVQVEPAEAEGEWLFECVVET